jgi:hypothetical protein
LTPCLNPSILRLLGPNDRELKDKMYSTRR